MDALFSPKNKISLESELAKRKKVLLKDVESLTESQLLGQSEHEIATNLADKHTVHCPELEQDPDQRRLVVGPPLEIHVPYEGEDILFFRRPNRFRLSLPHALVRPTKLIFIFENKELKSEEIQALLEEQLELIEYSLEASREMITHHNNALLGFALSAIQERKKKLLATRRTIEELDIPEQDPEDTP